MGSDCDMDTHRKMMKQSCKAQRKEKSKTEKVGVKYPNILTANLGKSSAALQQQSHFPSCPLNNDPTQPARNTSMVSLSISIGRDARTEVPEHFCQRHFINTFKYS